MSRPKDKKKHLEDLQLQLKPDWLGPAASEEERDHMEELLHKKGLSREDAGKIRKYLDDPDSYDRRDTLWWLSVKEMVHGGQNVLVARERHKVLKADEWLTAYFIAHDFTNAEIAKAIGMSERTVDTIRGMLRANIAADFNYENDKDVTDSIITKWFFGMRVYQHKK